MVIIHDCAVGQLLRHLFGTPGLYCKTMQANRRLALRNSFGIYMSGLSILLFTIGGPRIDWGPFAEK